MRRYLAVLIPFVSLSVLALAQSLPSIVSPELQKDGRVTFRFHAPNAAKVEITLEGQPHPFAMQKDDKGTWTVTLGPYDPDIYGYSIVQDGQPLIDPSNQLRKPNLLFTQSAVEIPGPGTASWEVNDIPHGELHHQWALRCRRFAHQSGRGSESGGRYGPDAFVLGRRLQYPAG